MSKSIVHYAPMPQSDGGADFDLVELVPPASRPWSAGKPSCRDHGAMSKVSPVFWRCLVRSCRAGCMEEETECAMGAKTVDGCTYYGCGCLGGEW